MVPKEPLYELPNPAGVNAHRQMAVSDVTGSVYSHCSGARFVLLRKCALAEPTGWNTRWGKSEGKERDEQEEGKEMGKGEGERGRGGKVK